MKFAKITTFILLIFLAVSLFLAIKLFVSLDTTTVDSARSLWIDVILYWAYILLVTAFLTVFIFEFKNAVSNKKITKNILITLSFALTVIGISYLFSDSGMPKFIGAEKFIENGSVTPHLLRWIGTGLIVSYILFAISAIALVWSLISRIFNSL